MTMAATTQIVTAGSEASGPNLPPVIRADPEIGALISPLVAWPDTAAPKIPPSVKFQPKCNPIGSHSERVNA